MVTAVGPPGTGVGVWFRRDGEQSFTRRRARRLAAAGRYTTSFASDVPQELFLRSATLATAPTSTLVGAVPDGLHVYAPDSIAPGRTVPVVVQGAPGAQVALWFSRAGEALNRRREGVLGADGTYRTSYTAVDEHLVLATSKDRSSTATTTRLSGAPLLTSAPGPAPVGLLAASSVDVGARLEVAVAARPGADGELWARRRGVATFQRVAAGRLGADGSWSTGLTAGDDTKLWATSGAGSSPLATSLGRPVLTGPRSVPLGTAVRLTGRARPGDRVVVERRRHGSTAFSASSVQADATGAFSTSYAADDAYDYRPVAAGRTGDLRQTSVAPAMTVAGPVLPGSVLRVTGTARPGAVVVVLVRTRSPSFGVTTRRDRPYLPARVARTVVADSAGRWATTVTARPGLRLLAHADGTTSRQLVVGLR